MAGHPNTGRKTRQREHITLLQRTELFNEQMRAQRVKLHPKSKDLSEKVRDIVKTLEVNFDGLAERIKSSPSPGTTWKQNALQMTLSEIPKIPLCGFETGDYQGFGNMIYERPEAIQRKLSPKLVKPDGTWRSFSDMNEQLRRINTPLTRSRVLKANSGRYVDEH